MEEVLSRSDPCASGPPHHPRLPPLAMAQGPFTASQDHHRHQLCRPTSLGPFHDEGTCTSAHITTYGHEPCAILLMHTSNFKTTSPLQVTACAFVAAKLPLSSVSQHHHHCKLQLVHSSQQNYYCPVSHKGLTEVIYINSPCHCLIKVNPTYS